MKDLIFGDLTVLSREGSTSNGVTLWKCRCVCGNETIVRGKDLRNGKTKSCGCLRSKKEHMDLTGSIFGNLKVISFHKKEKRRIFWNCLCSCGDETICATGTLRSGKAVRCYRCGRKTRPSGENGLSQIIKEYKHGAKKRNYVWNLTRDQVREITKQNCYYCGSEPSKILRTNTTDNHGDYIYNGIDRKDNNLGYEIENCVPCCNICNIMKMAMSESDFKNHIIKIYNFTNNG